MTTMTNEPTTRPRRSAVPLRVDLVSAGAAAVCALVLWLAVAVLGGVDLQVRSGGQLREVGGVAVAVLAVSVLGPLGATSPAAAGTLLALHAVVAAVLLVAAHRSRAAWVRTL